MAVRAAEAEEGMGASHLEGKVSDDDAELLDVCALPGDLSAPEHSRGSRSSGSSSRCLILLSSRGRDRLLRCLLVLASPLASLALLAALLSSFLARGGSSSSSSSNGRRRGRRNLAPVKLRDGIRRLLDLRHT